MIIDKQEFYESLIPKERDLVKVANLAIGSTELINHLIEGISHGSKRIKYGCSNTLVIISEKNPGLLYPHFDVFEKLLGSGDKFIKWAAINIIANLTKTDTHNKFDIIFESYFSEITGPVMITAANIIKGAAIIAKAKPDLTERITNVLLRIKDAEYQTDECRNIVFGHTITAFDKFFKQVEKKEDVISFIKSLTDNPRKPTKNKAEKFIKKWEKFQ